jgi:hypothetical protein
MYEKNTNFFEVEYRSTRDVSNRFAVSIHAVSNILICLKLTEVLYIKCNIVHCYRLITALNLYLRNTLLVK